MARFAFWIAVCVTLSIVLRKRPHLLVGFSLIVVVLVPPASAGLLTGSSTGIQPSVWLLLISLTVVLIDRLIGKKPPALRLWHWSILLLLSLYGSLITALQTGQGALLTYLNTFVAGTAIFTLLTSSHPPRAPGQVRSPSRRKMLTEFSLLYVILAALEALLAILQYALRAPLVYASNPRDFSWYSSHSARAIGTLDNPLDLALMLSAGTFLASVINRLLYRNLALIAMVSGLLATSSRLGIAIGGVGLLFSTIYPASKPILKAGSVVAFAGIGTFVITKLHLFDGISSRLLNDAGSVETRELANAVIREHLSENVWLGPGISASRVLMSSLGLRSSLENGYAIYALELGVVATILYIIFQGAIIAQGMRSRLTLPYAAAALACCIFGFTSSSFTNLGFTSIATWLLLGLINFSPSEHRDDTSVHRRNRQAITKNGSAADLQNRTGVDRSSVSGNKSIGS